MYTELIQIEKLQKVETLESVPESCESEPGLNAVTTTNMIPLQRVLDQTELHKKQVSIELLDETSIELLEEL
jgi:hypothetical protein